MDVLLRRLVDQDNLDPFGYVDDVPVGSVNYHYFTDAMFEIDVFSFFSGPHEEPQEDKRRSQGFDQV